MDTLTTEEINNLSDTALTDIVLHNGGIILELESSETRETAKYPPFLHNYRLKWIRTYGRPTGGTLISVATTTGTKATHLTGQRNSVMEAHGVSQEVANFYMDNSVGVRYNHEYAVREMVLANAYGSEIVWPSFPDTVDNIKIWMAYNFPNTTLSIPRMTSVATIINRY